MPSQMRFVACAVLLAVAMGVGRFVYTPLLVVMHREGVLSIQTAGALASVNLFGYLLGALAAMHEAAKAHRTAILRVGSILVVVTTAMMALSPNLWLAARLTTGIASGLVFVLTASLVIDLAAHLQSRYGVAIAFSGVGIGIAGAGALVAPFARLGGSHAAWLGLALVSALAIAFALPAMPSCEPNVMQSAPVKGGGSLFGWLAFLYGIEGAAYIIPATFLVAIVAQTPSIAHLGSATWILVGVVAAPSTLWWNAAARRFGLSGTLIAACTVQMLSMLALFVLPPEAAAIALAVGLGGTFVGIVAVSAAIARILRPANVNAAISFLTVLYGIGQIAGPLVATRIALATGSYLAALAVAAGALGIATAAYAVRAFKR